MAKKRAAGEGTIGLRKDGRYQVRLSLGGNKRKSFYAATQEEAVQILTRARAQFQQGTLVIERDTVSRFLDQWLEKVVKPKLENPDPDARMRLSTYISYKQQIDVHIKPALGRYEISRLTPQHIDRYIAAKRGALSTKTIKYHIAILRMAFKKAVLWRLMSQNIAMDAEVPKLKKYKAKPLTQDEARILIRAMEGDSMETYFLTVLFLGLRKGEGLALRWQDVDFDSGSVGICQSGSRLAGELVIGETKTESSRRVLRLHDFLAAKLRDHRRRQLEDRIAAGARWKDTGLVFTTRTGGMIDPRNVNRSLTRLLKAAEIEHRRVHDLRHTLGTLMLMKGEQIKVISDILGHTTTRITEDLYVHVVPTVAGSAIDLYGDILVSKLASNEK